ncbi:hypothetical protein GCM10007385_00530 [Tateyamaria omphalii]|uniref:hypothetical protein n=1 Tax=Tateyamaria omphalii TaxID=299262 RepID=UPI0016786451|nr:hypothetical protein [Tateyamaria omphalii]GGX37756.1 hypothetical protein GCM10007385_00530 [Tateyamaria omphalii]
MKDSFDDWPPHKSEDVREYCARLEAAGFEEMFLRKAAMHHDFMNFSEIGWARFNAFFRDFPISRLRHVALLQELAPNRTEYSLGLKVAKNLGLDKEAANALVKEFRSKEPVEWRSTF